MILDDLTLLEEIAYEEEVSLDELTMCYYEQSD